MTRFNRARGWLAIIVVGVATAGCEVDKALDDAASGKTEGREHIGGAASPVMSDELFSSSNRASKQPKPSSSTTPKSGGNAPPVPASSAPPVPASSAPPVPNVPATDGGDETATSAAPKPKTLAALDVQLTTGVSLAQTGPDGTLMSFSVDYQFVSSGPVAGRKYGLLVERRDGQSGFQEQELLLSGSIEVLAPGWRPQDGPFHGSIIELNSQGKPMAQSQRIELTGPSDP